MPTHNRIACAVIQSNTIHHQQSQTYRLKCLESAGWRCMDLHDVLAIDVDNEDLNSDHDDELYLMHYKLL